MFYEIPNTEITYRFDSRLTPCLSVESGDYLLFHTRDAHSGTINIKKVWADVPFPELDENTGNPVTGLVYVKGARPEMTLKVSILEILPDPVGMLPIRSYMGVLRDIVPERTARVVKYAENRVWINDQLSVPARPMVGTIGVAPKDGEIATGPPGDHGGNMDDNFITVGSEVYFPIYHDGAYLGLGDIHAVMGDAELTCGGVDICAHVLVKVEVVEAPSITQNPIVIKDNLIVTHGFAWKYPDAAKMACEEMCKILMNKLQISEYEAVLLMAARGDLGLCQACECSSIPMVVRVAFPILW
jgi:amidase